jgi:hypothetical protein
MGTELQRRILNPIEVIWPFSTKTGVVYEAYSVLFSSILIAACFFNSFYFDRLR